MWWSPRSRFPNSELRVTFRENANVLKDSHPRFVTEFDSHYRSLEALQDMLRYAAKDFTHFVVAKFIATDATHSRRAQAGHEGRVHPGEQLRLGSPC